MKNHNWKQIEHSYNTRYSEWIYLCENCECYKLEEIVYETHIKSENIYDKDWQEDICDLTCDECIMRDILK